MLSEFAVCRLFQILYDSLGLVKSVRMMRTTRAYDGFYGSAVAVIYILYYAAVFLIRHY